MEVVSTARAMESVEPAVSDGSRRPGWAGRLALEVLREARQPMRSGPVRRAIEDRLGEQVHKDTVLYALKRSRAARDGRIVRVADGSYVYKSG